MPGQRALENGDFVTPRAVYRAEIIAVDTDITSVGIPILDTRGGPNGNVVVGPTLSSKAAYGRNCQIDVSIIVQGFNPVVLELWLLAEVERAELSTATPPAVPTLPATGQYVFVESKSTTQSCLWTIKDIPPGQYKIYAKTLTGAGFVNIREQHAS